MSSPSAFFFDTRLGVEDQDFFDSKNRKISPKTKIAYKASKTLYNRFWGYPCVIVRGTPKIAFWTQLMES